MQEIQAALEKMQRRALSFQESKGSDQSIKKDEPPSKQSQDQSPEVALTVQQVANLEANRGLRDEYAKRAYRLVRGSLVVWWSVVLFQGVGSAFFNVEVWSSSVIIAVTTGVTVNVLAAFLGVIRGLFGKEG